MENITDACIFIKDKGVIQWEVFGKYSHIVSAVLPATTGKHMPLLWVHLVSG